MAKTPKKAWHKLQEKEHLRQKDDGTRWIVVRDGRPVYHAHGGTTKEEAERLAAGLREPATIIQVS